MPLLDDGEEMQVCDPFSISISVHYVKLVRDDLTWSRFGRHCHYAHFDENGHDIKDFTPPQREPDRRESERIPFDSFENFSSPHILYDEDGDIHFLGGDSDEGEPYYPRHRYATRDVDDIYGPNGPYNPHVIYDEEGEPHFLGGESDHHDDESSSSSS
jgi:hypothetical protein